MDRTDSMSSQKFETLMGLQDGTDFKKKKTTRSLSEEREKEEISSIVEENNQFSKVVSIGVCCMEKKSRSKEMNEILSRMSPILFRIEIFEERMILEDPIEAWPIVDCLMCFYSDGFPLNKAIQYSDLRKPFLINDVRKQQYLWDRKIIYTILKENNIPVPKHYFVVRNSQEDIIENYSGIERDNQRKIYQKKLEALEIVEGQIQLKYIEDCPEDISQNYENPDAEQIEPEKLKTSLSENNFLSRQNLQVIQDSSQKDPENNSIQSHTPNSIQKKNSGTQNQPFFKSSQRSSMQQKAYDLSVVELIKKQPQKAEQQVTDIKEFEDFLMIDGVKLSKPFVEKPFDAENHNIYIYYHSNQGGGCKKLFRKVGNQSSSFEQNTNEIRTHGNYIYECFLPTYGFDIKVYTVGEFYAHAEARKSPVLDGKVQRTESGKEVRYPVCLTPYEKLIATKIVNLFGQNVCGFDLLRCDGKSYVCDVNGWSFVKGNEKYYQDTATVLTQMILRKISPGTIASQLAGSTMYMKNISKNSFRPDKEDIESVQTQELRSVVSVFRHADRTPKQKMKMRTDFIGFLQFFDDLKDSNKELKLKHPKELTKLLEVTRQFITEFASSRYKFDIQKEDNILTKLLQMKSVLEKGGHFEGINRKIQLKPLAFKNVEKDGVQKQLPTEILVILKWGGELTQLGESQGIKLGQIFRNSMYPQDKEGLLRLHSTYRHDLKTYSSDEGRCQNTAAAFLKGFLGFEGENTPILASMVIKNQTAQKLLDCDTEITEVETVLKDCLSSFLQCEENLYEQIVRKFPKVSLTQKQIDVMKSIGNPREQMNKLHEMIGKLTRNIRNHLKLQEKDYYIRPEHMREQEAMEQSKNSQQMYHDGSESMILYFKRWYKLYYDFCRVKGNERIFNISKIPDIYDSIKFDFLHHSSMIQEFCENPAELFNIAELLQNFMVPFEYGLTTEQKISIAKQVVAPLCEKVKSDLLWWRLPSNRVDEDYWKYRKNDVCKNHQKKDVVADINSPWRHVRTRLYFTSASHMYSLFNILFHGLNNFLIEDEQKQNELEKINVLQYLSHIVIKLYENLSADINAPERFRLEISVSDGCQTNPYQNDKADTPISDGLHITQKLNLNELEEFLNYIIKLEVQESKQQE